MLYSTYTGTERILKYYTSVFNCKLLYHAFVLFYIYDMSLHICCTSIVSRVHRTRNKIFKTALFGATLSVIFIHTSDQELHEVGI